MNKVVESDWLVACLCAAWCGTCREYRVEFDALAERMPEVRFAWVDIEDEPDVAGDIDVENFPTLVIQYASAVLFCGTMLPHVSQLERLLQSFQQQTPDELHVYARASSERLAWQMVADVRARLPG